MQLLPVWPRMLPNPEIFASWLAQQHGVGRQPFLMQEQCIQHPQQTEGTHAEPQQSSLQSEAQIQHVVAFSIDFFIY
jgi:hypothetical protein